MSLELGGLVGPTAVIFRIISSGVGQIWFTTVVVVVSGGGRSSIAGQIERMQRGDLHRREVQGQQRPPQGQIRIPAFFVEGRPHR